MNAKPDESIFVDILTDRRNSSDIFWALKNWPAYVPFVKNKKPSSEDIKNLVLSNPKLLNLIKDVHEINGVSQPKDLLKVARKILDKMGYKRSVVVLRTLSFVTAKMLKHVYEGIYVNEQTVLELRSSMGNSPLLFVPSHRSYADFILFSYLCFHYDLDIPRIAAGMDFQSMTFMGEMLRETCAFFMRRSFTDDQLYGEIFSSYVDTLVTDGEAAIEFFIEGTRSRSGKSLFPKFGFLTMALKPFIIGKVHDIKIVPVGTNFERVLEETLFAYEVLGVPKPKETTKGFLKAAQILKERYGSVNFTFDKPLSVREFFNQNLDRSVHGFGPLEYQKVLTPESKLIKALSHEIIRRQCDAIVLNCFNVIAAAINNLFINGIHCFDFNLLMEDVKWLENVLIRLNTRFRLECNESNVKEMLVLHKNIIMYDLKGIRVQLVTQKPYDDLSSYCRISPQMVDCAVPLIILQHYANPIAHRLVSLSFYVLLLRKETSLDLNEAKKQYSYLRRIFAYEFVFDDESGPNYMPTESLGAYFVKGDKIYLGTNEKLIQFCINFLALFFPGYQCLINILLDCDFPIVEKDMFLKFQQLVEKKITHGEIAHPYNLSKELATNAVLGLIRMKAVTKDKLGVQFSYFPEKERLYKVLKFLEPLEKQLPNRKLDFSVFIPCKL